MTATTNIVINQQKKKQLMITVNRQKLEQVEQFNKCFGSIISYDSGCTKEVNAMMTKQRSVKTENVLKEECILQ